MSVRHRRGIVLAALLALGAVLVGLAVVSWLRGGIVASLVGPATDATRAEAVRALLEDSGFLAPVAYVLFVTVEVVVAPLPGVLLYAPGGVLFGGFWGGALALIGNILGAGIAFTLARRLGRDRARSLLRDSRMAAAERRLTDNGLLVVFLLRLNPLTSSDLVSYAAGLTSMPLAPLLTGTALGLAPLCWAQAYAAEGLVERFPWLLYPAVAAAVLYLLAAAWLVVRLLARGGGADLSRDREAP